VCGSKRSTLVPPCVGRSDLPPVLVQETSVSADIVQAWLGHGNQTVGDDCWMLKKNVWSGRVDLNHRPPGPEPGAKPC